jgi:hypothetical protein
MIDEHEVSELQQAYNECERHECVSSMRIPDMKSRSLDDAPLPPYVIRSPLFRSIEHFIQTLLMHQIDLWSLDVNDTIFGSGC